MNDDDTMPSHIISFIKRCTTIYLGTAALRNVDGVVDGHLGCNHRGGVPGFIRVRNDGKTVVIPDYSGNRFMT